LIAPLSADSLLPVRGDSGEEAPVPVVGLQQSQAISTRRVAVLDGIARIHVQWFRDGLGKRSLLVDLVRLVHARSMKMLAVFGAAPSNFSPGASHSKEQSGCPWRGPTP
jgi:hypothetical protein